MSSLLNRFKGSAVRLSYFFHVGATNIPTTQNTAAARVGHSSKRDANAPNPSPLERLIADAGPIREDGSDKFFGLENVSLRNVLPALSLSLSLSTN
jgi:hypothetical protein